MTTKTWILLPQYTNRHVYPIGVHRNDGAIDIIGEFNSAGGANEDCDRHARLAACAPELLIAARGALAALSQNATFPADITAAKKFLAQAIHAATGGAK